MQRAGRYSKHCGEGGDRDYASLRSGWGVSHGSLQGIVNLRSTGRTGTVWVRADHAADNAQQFANAVRVTVSSMWRPMHSAACRFSGLLTAAPEQPNSASGRRV